MLPSYLPQINGAAASVAGTSASCPSSYGSKFVVSGSSSERRANDASEAGPISNIDGTCFGDGIGNTVASKSSIQEQIPSSLPAENTEAAATQGCSEVGASAQPSLQQPVQQQVSIQFETLRKSRSQGGTSLIAFYHSQIINLNKSRFWR